MTPDRLVPACGDYRCTLPEHQRPRGPSLASSLQARSGVSHERDASAAAGPSRHGGAQGWADDRTVFEDGSEHGRPPTRPPTFVHPRLGVFDMYKPDRPPMARKWMAHEVMPGYSGRAATGTDRLGTLLGVTLVLIVIAVAASLRV